MRNKRWALLALVLVLGLIAMACQQRATTPGGEEEKPEYKIGFMGDLSGANALLVVGSRDGATLAIQQANEKGDLPIKLRIQPEDTVADKDKAVTLAQKLAADNRILAVVGPAFSGESFSAGPILQGATIPQITPSATNPGIAQQGFKLWWRAVGNDNSQGAPAPGVIFKVMKGTKVFVGHDKTAYGEGLATIVRDNIKNSNASALVGFEAVDPGKEDYSAIASKLVSSGADVFFWGAYSPEAGKILTQARAKGFKGQFLGADGSKDEVFLKGAGTNAEGARLLCPCADVTTSDDPIAEKFVEDYSREEGALTIYAAEGYDATNIIIEAIRKAGKPGSDIKAYRQKIGDNIRATKDFKGTSKTYSWQENGELVDESVTIYLYEIKSGKFVLVGKVEDLIK